MPSHYSYATVTNTLNAIGARLYDPTFQQWTQDELLLILKEALRTWNVLSGFWRAEFTFNLAANTWWYDLRSVSNTLIPYTVTKYSLIEMVENHLLEPPTPGAWSGSSQFSLNDILTAFQRRQDETLGETGCTLVRSTVGAAPLTPRTLLSDSVIDIRRVAWLPVSGPAGAGYSAKPLRQSDMFATRAFNPNYTVNVGAAAPGKWMQNTEPPPSFDVDAPPPVNGDYDLLTINAGPTWTAGSDGLLTIPDDWTWVLKYGALMDLFSRESNAADPYRTEYCRRRYEEGKALLFSNPVILAARINNRPKDVTAIRGADDYNPSWQALTAGAPRSLYSAANLLAVAPKPDAGPYSCTVTVCQNAPWDATYVQVARDDYDTILDLSQHIGMLKQGGEEFFKTIALYQRAQRQAALYNSKLKEMGFFEMAQLETSTEQERRTARYLPGEQPSVS